MKLLHTSDWHLGQKFLSFDREKEHRMALEWLLQTIRDQQVDVLIVAGDVFDIGNPPNYARTLYYRFLAGLTLTPCRHAVFIGGNHDSPSMLDAPREILKTLNVHVVGSATGDIEDEVIELLDEEGNPEMVVAAVPFLRDRDLRSSEIAETGQQRIDRIRKGIFNHYQEIGRRMEAYAELNIPLIATGHLYADGAVASAKQDNIYIGDIENIRADQFPEVFDYVALGHIHRPQKIGGKDHVRYCGSLIPLSFSETKDEKAATLIEWKDRTIKSLVQLPIPIYRRLKTIEGTLEKVREKLEVFHERHQEELTPWVEVLLDSDTVLPGIGDELNAFAKELHLEIVKLRTRRPYQGLADHMELDQLEDLSPEEVFEKVCLSAGQPPEELEQLKTTFRELQNWMQEQEEL
jgi:exonuclease SbcD